MEFGAGVPGLRLPARVLPRRKTPLRRFSLRPLGQARYPRQHPAEAAHRRIRAPSASARRLQLADALPGGIGLENRHDIDPVVVELPAPIQGHAAALKRGDQLLWSQPVDRPGDDIHDRRDGREAQKDQIAPGPAAEPPLQAGLEGFKADKLNKTPKLKGDTVTIGLQISDQFVEYTVLFKSN